MSYQEIKVASSTTEIFRFTAVEFVLSSWCHKSSARLKPQITEFLLFSCHLGFWEFFDLGFFLQFGLGLFDFCFYVCSYASFDCWLGINFTNPSLLSAAHLLQILWHVAQHWVSDSLWFCPNFDLIHNKIISCIGFGIRNLIFNWLLIGLQEIKNCE